MGRMNFATALASGLVPGVKLDSSRLEGKDAPGYRAGAAGTRGVGSDAEALAKGLEGKEPTAGIVSHRWCSVRRISRGGKGSC